MADRFFISFKDFITIEPGESYTGVEVSYWEVGPPGFLKFRHDERDIRVNTDLIEAIIELLPDDNTESFE